jgi:hypothetical protein
MNISDTLWHFCEVTQRKFSFKDLFAKFHCFANTKLSLPSDLVLQVVSFRHAPNLNFNALTKSSKALKLIGLAHSLKN